MMGTKRWGLSPARKRKPKALYGAESKKASKKIKYFSHRAYGNISHF
jgi:hypothetical protein